jgi:AbrB family looped-hinge helix DNA binding protein
MRNSRSDIKVYGVTTIGTKGQIVIPAELRADLDLKPGDQVVIVGSAHKQFTGVLRDDVFQTFLGMLQRRLDGLDLTGQKNALKQFATDYDKLKQRKT